VLALPTLYGLVAEAAGEGGLPDLRLAIVAGERCPADLAARSRGAAPGAELVNEYGPTEATVWSTAWRCAEVAPDTSEVPIGRPVANGRAYVLGTALDPVPVGLPGELYVGGAGIARGYLGRAALTAERFLPDPFGPDPGSRMYRTGDLARLLPSGVLEYLGRADDQVKIRGQRVEPGEVEGLLGRHPDVAEAAVVVQEDALGEVRLAAYVVPLPGRMPEEAELRGFLRERATDAMVPSAVAVLPELPRLSSGKVDRRALRSGTAGTQPARAPYAAPLPGTETRLAAIWAQVLRTERVGRDDDFFEVGGHSLMALELAARIRDAFGVELPLTALFDFPTLAALAAEVEAGVPAGSEAGG
jgi:syringomycin synthetase protein SyrE